MAQTRNSTPAAAASADKSQVIRPVKDVLTKSALVNLISEQNGIPRDTVKGVLASLESALLGSVHPRGAGEFTLPGLLKITLLENYASKSAGSKSGNADPQSGHR